MNSTILGHEETDLTSKLIQEKDRCEDEGGWLIMAYISIQLLRLTFRIFFINILYDIIFSDGDDLYDLVTSFLGLKEERDHQMEQEEELEQEEVVPDPVDENLHVGHGPDLELLLIEELDQEEEFELEEVVPVPVEDNVEAGHEPEFLLMEELDQDEESELEEAL